ncbi:MAG TPA: S26 family signal peptidase [Patescibacteria group bacterium]|nr:S26 family signal peptidase [Patescibacteria group bacterium]
MTAPPFALPDPNPPAPPDRAPAARGAHERVRRLCAVAALGAAATAATLVIAAAIVIFEQDVIKVLARPASIPADIAVGRLREIASLPGPSPLVAAALLPAVALLLLAGVLRRLGRDAPPIRRVSAEALQVAEQTMAWAVRIVVAGAFLVLMIPALLQLAGLQAVSLTTGSMAPAHPAGSLLLVSRPSTPATVPVGTVVVIGGPNAIPVTHRIVALVHDEVGTVVGYRTRGDAVAEIDPLTVAPASIVGVVVGGVPVVGALRAWMASPLGMAIGLVLAWAFAGLAALLGDERRRARAPDQPEMERRRPILRP